MGSSNIVGIFHGFTVADIQRWLGVSRATAYRYRSGEAMPSRAAVRLLRLHQDRRILGPEWDGWCIRGDMLGGPEGQEIMVGQLRGYAMMLQAFHARAAVVPEIRRVFEVIYKSSAHRPDSLSH